MEKTSTTMPSTTATEKENIYKSQFSQDRVVKHFYGDKVGYFVEVGAYDGVTASNTYALERTGWTGILIEPLKEQYAKLVENRKCITVNECVYSGEETVDFSEYDLLSGISCHNTRAEKKIESLSQNLTDSVSQNLTDSVSQNLTDSVSKADKNPVTEIVKTSMKSVKLTSILNNANAPKFIEYLSLDTNGAEFEILKGVDFNTYVFGFINVDYNAVNDNRMRIRQVLIDNGYVYISENNTDDNYIHGSMLYKTYYINGQHIVILDKNSSLKHSIGFMFDFGKYLSIGTLYYDRIEFQHITWYDVPKKSAELFDIADVSKPIEMSITNPIYLYNKFLALIVTTKAKVFAGDVISEESISFLKGLNIVPYFVIADGSLKEIELISGCPCGSDGSTTITCIVVPVKEYYRNLSEMLYLTFNYFVDKTHRGIIVIHDNVRLTSNPLNEYRTHEFYSMLLTHDIIGKYCDPFFYVAWKMLPTIRESRFDLLNGVSCKQENMYTVQGIFSLKNNYVTIKLEAGFGNLLFQVACMLGYAEKTGKEPLIVKSLIHFQGHYSTDLCIKHILKSFPSISYVENIDMTYFFPLYYFGKIEYGNKYSKYNVYRYFDIPHYDGSIILEGRFMTNKFFPKQIQFRPIIEPDINITYPDYSDTYFLHFRMGDYTGDKFHGVDLMIYYETCIADLRAKNSMMKDLKSLKFVVCYNGKLEDAKAKFNTLCTSMEFKNDEITATYQTQDDNPYNTLYIMSQCEGGICANSTLSWMGAYLLHLKNKTELYMPSKWGNKIDGLADNHYIEIYPSWAILKDT